MIRELNLRYLKHNGPTDCISFDLSEKKGELIAEIAVSTDTAVRQSKAFSTSGSYETLLYVIHGLLHLLGYDDNKTEESAIMSQRQENLCSRLYKYVYP